MLLKRAGKSRLATINEGCLPSGVPRLLPLEVSLVLSFKKGAEKNKSFKRSLKGLLLLKRAGESRLATINEGCLPSGVPRLPPLKVSLVLLLKKEQKK